MAEVSYHCIVIRISVVEIIKFDFGVQTLIRCFIIKLVIHSAQSTVYNLVLKQFL